MIFFYFFLHRVLHFVFCVLYFVNEHNSGLTSSYYSILVVRAGISILTAISGQKPNDDDDEEEEDVDDDNDIPITYDQVNNVINDGFKKVGH